MLCCEIYMIFHHKSQINRLHCIVVPLAYEEGYIRLAGGQEYSEGRVEIFHDGVWGTICDDGWDINDAHVVCRQLRFPGAAEAPGSAAFGAGNKTTMLLLCAAFQWLMARL